MIKLRNICLRLSSLGLAACLIMSLFLPVSAAGPYDFWDMNPMLTPDGENTIVSVSVPTDLCYSLFRTSSGLRLVSGSSFQSAIPVGDSAEVFMYSFGSPSVAGGLLLDDIPSGTNLQILFEIDVYPSLYNVSIACGFDYYDSSGNLLLQDPKSITVSSGQPFLFDFVINKPANASYLVVNFYQYYSEQSIERTVSYNLMSSTLSMTLDSLLVQQQQTGRTNAILQKVEQQLADQGQTLDDVLKEQQDTNDKLDDIINGTVEPSSPAGSGAVDDLINQEDQLIQDITPGLDDYDDITDTAMNGLGGYIGALMGVSWLIDTLINVPFIMPLVYLSLALGLTGTVLGVFNTVVRAASNKSDARSGKG